MSWAEPGWSAGDCRMHFQVQGTTLRVELAGATGTAQARLACWTRVSEQVQCSGAGAVLAVDRREGALAAPGEWRALLKDLDLAAFKNLPLAYVGSWPRVAQMEALNLSLLERGFRAQVFDDEAAAARWLRYGEHGRALRPG
ncbi:MAG TPA: hypothetical protein VD865_06525 [Stenotrophomonas sp.]|nr:hypothetical protein [Stenotrophomonas sp.]